MKPPLCPTCFAKEMDPILLHYDENDSEHYCTKCTWFGSYEEARNAIRQLMHNKHRVEIGPGPSATSTMQKS